MIISIIGSADSGKTTLINEILANKEKILGNTNTFYKGDGDILLVNLFKKFFGTSQTESYNNSKLYNKSSQDAFPQLISHIYTILYFIAVLIDFTLDYIKYEIIFKNKILLKDRYIYDFYTTFKVNHNIANRFILWPIEKFPKPSVIIHLSATSENLYYRNKNNIPGAITSKKDFFDRVVNSYNEIVRKKRILSIDNNEDLLITVKKASEVIEKTTSLRKHRKIIVCGPDGAGKSTIVKNLSDMINSLGIETKVVHFYHDTLLYKLLKRIGFYKSEVSDENQFKKNYERAIKRHGKNKPYWWALLNLADAYIQIWLSRIFNPSKVIIFDRYLYDFLVSFEYYNVPGYRNLFRQIDKNNLSFLVISDPAILYKRKPENLLSYFEFAYTKYHEIAKTFGMQIIDTTYSDQDKAIELLWSKI